MEKRFCAVCNIEKFSSNPFKVSGENTDFCKQCRGITTSYWAEEPKSSVDVPIRKNRTNTIEKKRVTEYEYIKKNPVRNTEIHIEPEIKLSPNIEQEWKQEALYREKIAKKLSEEMMKAKRQQKIKEKERRKRRHKAKMIKEEKAEKRLKELSNAQPKIQSKKQQDERSINQFADEIIRNQKKRQNALKHNESMSMELGDIAAITKVSKIENSKKTNSVETNKKQ